MSRLKTQLDEAARLTSAMLVELKRRRQKADDEEARGHPGYEDFDTFRADLFADSVELLGAILDAYAAEEPGITLRFDAGADSDMFDNVFGHLADGYVIEVNGTNMVCLSTGDDPGPGLYGLVWDDEEGEATGEPIGVSWDDLESVTIY